MAVIDLGQRNVPGGQGQKAHGISITWPDIPAWVPEQARVELSALVVSSMRLALQVVAGHVSDLAPRSEGTLGQSFGNSPATSIGGQELIGNNIDAGISGRVFSSLPYAVVMNDGRNIGSPISRAGIDAIGLWAQRKLGLSADEADNAKWAIAKHIVEHGFEGNQYFDKGVAAAGPTIEQMFAILAEQIKAALFTNTGKKRDANLSKFIGRVGKN